MLILLSDLHFMDGTAGVDNLDYRVYRRMFDDMADRAREADASEVKIALLGDIFDLVRTEYWFDLSPESRPWGEKPSEASVIDAFDAIVKHNLDTFDLISGSLVDRFDFPVEPEFIYIPGNHDRLCNSYPDLRSKVRSTLGMAPGSDPFDRVLLEPDYGVYARHGHEFDPYNYEGTPVFGGQGDTAEESAYDATPIGDVIACEFASRLPVLVRSHLSDDAPDGHRLVDKFRELFDVRPMAAIGDWLELQRMRQPEPLEKVINQSMQECAEDFSRIPFVERWLDRHDDWRNPIDEADKIQMLLGLLRWLNFTQMDVTLNLVRTESQAHEQLYPQMAKEDLARLDADPELRHRILYPIYGHTHVPYQEAIGVAGEGKDERDRVYVNTGTWRPSHRAGVDGSGFVTWNNLAVTYVYKAGEVTRTGRKHGYPTFETWSGAFC